MIELGPEVPAVYQMGTSCQLRTSPVPDSTYRHFELGAVVPPSTFAKATLVTDQ